MASNVFHYFEFHSECKIYYGKKKNFTRTDSNENYKIRVFHADYELKN